MIDELNCEFVKNCPLCGDDGVLQLGDLKDYFFNTSGIWEVSCCKKCQHTWLSKRLLESFIHVAYENYYTHQSSTKIFNNNVVNYFTKLLSGKDVFQKYHMHSKSVLDVGCGNGDYLNSLINSGINNCVGIDFDENAVKYCEEKGLNVQCATVDEFASYGRKFDIVVINHVLEHVYDVKNFINSVKLLVNSNGLVCIRTPNNNSFSLAFFNKYWRGLEVPRHINLFSRKSLELLAIEFSISSIENYTHNDYRLVRGSWIASIDAFLCSKEINLSIKNSKLRYLTIFTSLIIKIFGYAFLNRGEELVFVGRVK